MATNRQSWGKSRPSSEPAAGAATYASTEVRWSEDRLSEGEGLVSSRGICGITLSYARPVRVGGRRNLSVAAYSGWRKRRKGELAQIMRN